MKYLFEVIIKWFIHQIEMNSSVWTGWITVILLIVPAYDIIRKRKKIKIAICNIRNSESTSTREGKTEQIKFTDISIELLNQSENPIGVMEVEVRLFDNDDKKTKNGSSYTNVNELSPRDKNLYSKQFNKHVSMRDIFYVKAVETGGKVFKMYPNDKYKSIIKFIMIHTKILSN